jgi:uncharacterized glyoxalase superfamily protein PhnB
MTSLDSTVTVRELVPLLFVADIEKSARFYCETLGFSMSQSWEPNDKLAWCRLDRGDAAIMLQQATNEDGPAAGRGNGVEFFFLCDDANAMHAELRARGLDVKPPKVAFYGMNQLLLKDPDGYGLCFQNVVQSA